MNNPAIRISNLGKRYRLGNYDNIYRSIPRFLGMAPKNVEPDFWALQNISVEIGQGEVVGVIGPNGAGKSTLLKILSRITRPTHGRFELHGRVGSLLEVGTGFHSELTGRENIYLNGLILGMRKAEVERKFDEIVAFSGVEEFLDTPVKRYSSGMSVRLAFSVAAHLEPEILLIDEVLAVGDAEFQRKCLGKMEDVSARQGRTVIFVSHSMSSIAKLCPRGLLLDHGILIKDGPIRDVIGHYMQSGLGTTAARSWPDLGHAPGDDLVRLWSARVTNYDGEKCDTVDIQDDFYIELTYQLLSDCKDLYTSVQVINANGTILFVTSNMNLPTTRNLQKAGVYTARIKVPGNLMTEGSFLIRVLFGMMSPWRKRFSVPDVIAFTIIDAGKGDSVRGDYPKEIPGVIRPLLDWHIEKTQGHRSAQV